MQDLREAASHRGLKLVKSRKRKPGVGDYGLFGLTDADGKPLFGMSDGGLTATPDQIVAVLRERELSTWSASTASTPDPPKPVEAAKSAIPHVDDVALAIRPRKRRPAARLSPALPPGPPAEIDVTVEHGSLREEAAKSARTTRSGAFPKPRSSSRLEPEPATKLDLVIRAARPKDAEALLDLLRTVDQALSVTGLKRAISNAASRKEPILVAELGDLIGCLEWHMLSSLRGGDIARIVLLFVRADSRLQGVGRKLYERAAEDFRQRKVMSVEGMSEIEVRNANAFYRAIGLQQSGYQFVTEF